MNPSPPPPTDFDIYADGYQSALDRGLKLSGESKEFFATGRIQRLKQRLSSLSFIPTQSIDYGCGTGTSIPLLLSLPGAESVTGVDLSSRSLSVARQQFGSPRTRFLLPAELSVGEPADLAFCNGVFHHIPLADRLAVVKWIADHLRPGGVFAVFENNPWNPGTRWVMSRIPFDRDAIPLSPSESRRLLQAGGFEIVATDFLFFFPRFLSWFRGLESRLYPVPLGAQYLVLAQRRLS